MMSDEKIYTTIPKSEEICLNCDHVIDTNSVSDLGTCGITDTIVIVSGSCRKGIWKGCLRNDVVSEIISEDYNKIKTEFE